MIAFVTATTAVLYSFPWLRIPDLFGSPFPLQRVLGWIALAFLFIATCRRGTIVGGGLARAYLAGGVIFLAVAALSLFTNTLARADVNVFRGIIEISKLVAVFSVGYLCYYALHRRLVRERRFLRLVVVSGVLCIVVSLAFLVLYWAGLRTTNEILANSFGGALGVWPTGQLFPRLAGPTVEPQQLSVVFITPLCLMLTRAYFHRCWPLAFLGVLVLILSQSKFALVSLVLVFLYAFAIFRRNRDALLVSLLALLPLAAVIVAALPVFQSVAELGLEAGAFSERLDNAAFLSGTIRDFPLLGIGLGQYGTYRGEVLFGDPLYNPNYFANNDPLSILAETGMAGFAVVTALLGVLFWNFIRAIPVLEPAETEVYLAFLVGAVAISLNMLIGYEFTHAFFWINIGVLLHFVERLRQRRARTAPPPP